MFYPIYDQVGRAAAHSVMNFGEVELDDIGSHHYSEIDHPYDTVLDQTTAADTNTGHASSSNTTGEIERSRDGNPSARVLEQSIDMGSGPVATSRSSHHYSRPSARVVEQSANAGYVPLSDVFREMERDAAHNQEHVPSSNITVLVK